MTILPYILIFIGAGLGALLRWFLGERLNHLLPSMPLGTLAANLLGGILIGIALGWFSRHPGLPPEFRLLVVTGFLGGLTTFSTFSAEVTTLLLRGEYLWGLGAAAIHLLGSLALTTLGLVLTQLLLTRS